MAAKEDEAGEEQRNRSISRAPSDPSSHLDVSSFAHTPFYCEENVYFLCKKLCALHVSDPKGNDLFVVFISNEDRKVPLWHQKASKRADGLVIWDYHVICIQLKQGHFFHLVWDLDSSLPLPYPLNQYFAKAIQPMPSFVLPYSRLFRVVHAPIFLRYFASDRSHMKDDLGTWMSLPPAHEPIVAEDGNTNNLDEYIRMCDEDIMKNLEGSNSGAFSNRFGVVLNESMLEGFFSQIQ